MSVVSGCVWAGEVWYYITHTRQWLCTTVLIKTFDCETQISISWAVCSSCQILEHRKCYPLSTRFLGFILISPFSFLMTEEQLSAPTVGCFEALLKRRWILPYKCEYFKFMPYFHSFFKSTPFTYFWRIMILLQGRWTHISAYGVNGEKH